VKKMSRPKLSISIPLYNESTNCESGIKDIVKHLDKHVKNYELILVNNGSSDDTKTVINKLSAKHSKVKTIHLKKNIGYGGGYIKGLKESKGEYIGHTVADGQINGNDLIKVFNDILRDKADFGKSVRVKRLDGIKRIIFTTGYETVINTLFLTRIRDINGYPKIMKRNILKKLNLQHKDWFTDTEMILKVKKLKLKTSETPVIFKARDGGTSNVNYGTAMELFIAAVKTRFKGLKF